MKSLWQRIGDWFEGEEEVLALFPSYAVRDEKHLRMTLRAWVYEPEESSLFRNAFIDKLRDEFGLDDDSPQAKLFRRRARPFMVDNERWQNVRVRIAGEVFPLGRSASDGHVEGELYVPLEAVTDAIEETPVGEAVHVRAFIDSAEHERLVPIVSDAGRSVISDIDDTMKVTGVLDRKEMMRNTFLRPFKPLRAMSERYTEWASEPQTSFHYVSSSPWQLLPFLEQFVEEHSFPRGSFHLRKLRPKSVKSPIDFLTSSEDHKHANIGKLLDDFPARTFILVGDSGEKDPEIYGEVVRRHPNRVEKIVIRRVPGSDDSDARFDAAFEDVDVPLELVDAQ